MPADNKVVAEWKRRVAEYERIVEKFEQLGNDMRARRKGAIDSVMVMLDERLKLNDRTLASMRQGLKSAKEQLKRFENREGL